MDLVAMGFFNGLVAFSILRLVFTVDPRRHAMFLLALIPVGSFAYTIFTPMLLSGAVAALLGTAIGGVVYMAGEIYKKTELAVNNKMLTLVNSMQLVGISLITLYIYPTAAEAEPIRKIFGDVGFNFVVGVIVLLAAVNICANIVRLEKP